MSEKEFKVKLIFPVTSFTWRETSNTLCLMEWHKASLRAGADGFDRDQPGGMLVLRGRSLTRSPPPFQCVAWQPAFRWWGPNKTWQGVTPVHACWQPPTPAPPETTPLPSTTPATTTFRLLLPFITEAWTSLHVEPSLGCYCGRRLLVSDGLNDSIYLIKYSSGRGMLGMGLVSEKKRGWRVCICGASMVKKSIALQESKYWLFIPENHR